VTLTLDETARLVGGYRWVEMRLFETLGGWVTSVPELDVKLHLGTRCYHHAWHAQLWQERLPTLAGADPEQLTAPSGGAVSSLVAALTRAEGTIEKLVGVYRVLVPRKVAAYTAHLERASPVCDAPVMRALRLVLADEMEEWRDGERLIQALLSSPEAVGRAAEHQCRLETLMVGAAAEG
jgi:hypothetical protein